MLSRIVVSAALAALLAGGALAQEVYCGSFTPMTFKVKAGGKEPAARADQAMEVINKYLGGKAPTVTPKPDGPNYKLMINKDVLALVTPADAKAAKSKSVKILAQDWTKKLQKALKETAGTPG